MYKSLAIIVLGSFLGVMPVYSADWAKLICINSNVDDYIKEQIETAEELDSFPAIADFHWEIALGCENATYATRYEFFFERKNLKTASGAAEMSRDITCGQNVSKPTQLMMTVNSDDIHFEGNIGFTLVRKTLKGVLRGQEDHVYSCEILEIEDTK